MAEILLEPGDILLVKGTNLISYPIRWFTHSEYSHAMLYAGEMYGEPLIVEAGAMGCWINTLRNHRPEYDKIDVFRVKTEAAYRHSTPLAGFEYVSKPYGYREILGFSIALSTGLRFNPFHNSEEIFCSELIDLAYLGLWSREKGTKGLVAPGTIASSQYVERLGPLLQARLLK